MNNRHSEKRKRDERLSPLKKSRTKEEEIEVLNGHFEEPFADDDLMMEEDYYEDEESLNGTKPSEKNIVDKDFYNDFGDLFDEEEFLESHGNAADIGGMFDFLVLLYDKLGVNVLHYDYIGYGLTKDTYGFPSEESTYESAEAALDFLHDQGINNKDIIIFGTSVGSGPSCHLASKEKDLLGLILECPFLSCVRVVTNNMLLRPIDMFVNINKIGKVTSPVFILHGSVDQVIAQQHGIELYAGVQDRYKWKGLWIDQADHHDMIEVLGLEKYVQVMLDFIKDAKNTHSQNSVTLGKKIEIKVQKDVDTKFDDSKPTCNVQIQLVNGEKVKGIFNPTQKVSDIYVWISRTTSLEVNDFDLLISYPKKNLNEEKDNSLEEAKLEGNCSLIQHFVGTDTN
eukprot:gene10948-3654_t